MHILTGTKLHSYTYSSYIGIFKAVHKGTYILVDTYKLYIQAHTYKPTHTGTYIQKVHAGLRLKS